MTDHDRTIRDGNEQRESPLLVQFHPARAPRDGRVVSREDVFTELRNAGIQFRDADWRPAWTYVGSKGGGPGEAAILAFGIGLAASIPLGVAKGFSEALGKQLWEQLQAAVRRVFSRRESQIQEAQALITIELGSSQWLELTLNPSQLEAELAGLNRLELSITVDEPRLWYIRFDPALSSWTVSTAPFQYRDHLPPTFRDK